MKGMEVSWPFSIIEQNEPFVAFQLDKTQVFVERLI